MPELHLRNWGFTCSACGSFTKHHKSISKFRKTGELNYIYKNELDSKDCLAHDAANTNSKDLAKKTILDKILKDRAYEITLNPEYDGSQRGLESKVYQCFDKKTGSGANVN